MGNNYLNPRLTVTDDRSGSSGRFTFSFTFNPLPGGNHFLHLHVTVARLIVRLFVRPRVLLGLLGNGLELKSALLAGL